MMKKIRGGRPRRQVKPPAREGALAPQASSQEVDSETELMRLVLEGTLHVAVNLLHRQPAAIRMSGVPAPLTCKAPGWLPTHTHALKGMACRRDPNRRVLVEALLSSEWRDAVINARTQTGMPPLL